MRFSILFLIALLFAASCRKIDEHEEGEYSWSYSIVDPGFPGGYYIAPELILASQEDEEFSLRLRKSGDAVLFWNGARVARIRYDSLNPTFLNGRLYTNMDLPGYDNRGISVRHCFHQENSSCEALWEFTGTYAGTFSTNHYDPNGLYYLPSVAKDTMVQDSAEISLLSDDLACLIQVEFRGETYIRSLDDTERQIDGLWNSCNGRMSFEQEMFYFGTEGLCSQDGGVLPVYFSFNGRRVP